MFTLTQEFITRNIRIALFALSGALISKGIVTESLGNAVAGGALQVITWAWSLWGNRLVARINEIVKTPNFIVIAPDEVAAAVPSPSAIPMQAVTVIAPAPIANRINADNPEANLRSTADVVVTPR